MRVSLTLCACAFLSLAAGRADRYARLLPAIEQVESGGKPDAVGDGGKAVGILQIHPILVRDVNRIAKEKRLGVKFTYADRLDPDKSRQMFRIYSDHYAKVRDDYTEEGAARRWNGGTDGHTQEETLGYWEEVKAAMGGGK